MQKNCFYLKSRCFVLSQFAKQKAAELEDFQGNTAALGEGIIGEYFILLCCLTARRAPTFSGFHFLFRSALSKLIHSVC